MTGLVLPKHVYHVRKAAKAQEAQAVALGSVDDVSPMPPENDGLGFDLGAGKPEIDTTIPQHDDTELEVSFVEATSEPDAPEPVARRAQNDPSNLIVGPIPLRTSAGSGRRARPSSPPARSVMPALWPMPESVALLPSAIAPASVALDGVDLRIRTTVAAIKAAKTEDDVLLEVDFAWQLTDLRQVRQQIVLSVETRLRP